jgi:hypothetical protein
VTLAAPSTASAPHVEAVLDQAAAVTQAVEAVLSAQNPSLLNVDHQYTLSAVSCVNARSPGVTRGYGCTLLVGADASTAAMIATPGAPAQDLFQALVAAGAKECNDIAHGEFLSLEHVSASSASLRFDDVSNYSTTPAPNLVLVGNDARNLIAALSAAEVDDCDPARALQLVCNKTGVDAACSYTWQPLTEVDGARLVATCGPASGDQVAGAILRTADSNALWQALTVGAMHAGVAPLRGSFANSTVLNAGFFRWDGTHLGCHVTIDDATPPPPRSH